MSHRIVHAAALAGAGTIVASLRMRGEPGDGRAADVLEATLLRT
jgi:hypothetical protein